MPEEGTAAHDLIEHIDEMKDLNDSPFETWLFMYFVDKYQKLDSKEDAWKLIEFDLTLPGDPYD